MAERRAFGLRATVGLTVAVAVLAVLTGLLAIAGAGPLAGVVPPAVRRTAAFTGAATGFPLLVSALGLWRGLRAAYYASVVLLVATTIQAFAQSSAVSLLLVALSLSALVALARNRGRFDRSLSLTTGQFATLLAVVGAQAYGTVGAYVLREEFIGVTSLVDAMYFALVTASTVGYGDVTATTPRARLFALSVVLLGTASFALALGTLLVPPLKRTSPLSPVG